MRIAQLSPLSENVPPKNQHGLEYVIHYLTEELVKRGHEVTLFAPKNSKTSARLVAFVGNEIFEDPARLPYNKYVYHDLNTLLCFSMAKQFDVIHAHFPIARYHASFIQTPVVVTIHSPKKPPPFVEKKVQHLIRPLFHAQNFFTVCISKSQYREREEHWHTFIVPNGIPIERFPFQAKPKDYFAYLGYVIANKGADFAVKAAQLAKKKLLIAGRFVKDSPFFDKKIKPHLGETIHYLGPLSFRQKIAFLKNAQALLMPIRWNEPFGMVMIEAMACGTPVIGFRKAAIPEIVQHEKTGFIVNTVQEMSKAMNRIETINRAECRKHVEKKFSIQTLADHYEKIYQTAIAKTQKARSSHFRRS